jgi:DNA-binding NtrC family response regulator
MLIEVALRRAGHEVALAVDAAGALTIASDEKQLIDLLLTDYTMPGRSGVELAADIRAMRPDIAVVLMSGWRLDEPVIGVPGQPVVLLEKPFDLTALAGAVERALEARGRT